MTPEERLTLAAMRADVEHMAEAAAEVEKADGENADLVGYLTVKGATTTWDRYVRREPSKDEIETLAATHGDAAVEERWPAVVRMIAQRELYRSKAAAREAAKAEQQVAA